MMTMRYWQVALRQPWPWPTLIDRWSAWFSACVSNLFHCLKFDGAESTEAVLAAQPRVRP